MKKEKILLFIPGYNCENQIIRVLKQLDEKVMKIIDEVIFVNNRSTDNTEENVKKFKEKNKIKYLKILKNDQNYGLGGSHKVAFKYAKEKKFDYVIVLHGDDQGEIHDILSLLETNEYKKYDSLLGARFMRNSKLLGYSRFRTFGNRVYNLLFSIVVGKRIFDLGSGLNIYKVSSLKSEYYKKFPDNLMFNYCMILATKYYKQNIKFFPISWREDDQVSNVKMVNQAINVLKILFKFMFNKNYINSEFRNKPVLEYTAKEVK